MHKLSSSPIRASVRIPFLASRNLRYSTLRAQIQPFFTKFTVASPRTKCLTLSYRIDPFQYQGGSIDGTSCASFWLSAAARRSIIQIGTLILLIHRQSNTVEVSPDGGENGQHEWGCGIIITTIITDLDECCILDTGESSASVRTDQSQKSGVSVSFSCIVGPPGVAYLPPQGSQPRNPSPAYTKPTYLFVWITTSVPLPLLPRYSVNKSER